LESRPNDTMSTEEELAQTQIADLAAQIKDEKQLRSILLAAHIGLRWGVYNQIVPHLTFKPREYRKLMKHA
jgi:hypothetical protein